MDDPFSSHGHALRIGLAARAYDAGAIRLASDDLGGLSHLVATRRGLFAASPRGKRLIAWGQYFGLTVDGGDLYAFEACDDIRAATDRGRLIRLRRRGDRIVAAAAVATGLPNGCHQIDLIDGLIWVVDTYGQRLIAWTRDGRFAAERRPLPGGVGQDWRHGYVHMNALLAVGDRRYLLLHNGLAPDGPNSEIAVLDADWRPIARRPLAARGCHGLAMLEDGTLLSCASSAGGLVAADGSRIAVGALMTRGLSVDEGTAGGGIVVGGSRFAARERRDQYPGAVYFLDRAGRSRATLAMPAPVTEICRIDGRDRSLSAFLAGGM